MTLRGLASKIAKLEGKKSQARIGDIREILKIFFQIYSEDQLAVTELVALEVDKWTLKRTKSRSKKSKV
jgi:hypothetical protein